MDATENPRSVIAGGGIAALEACLALRDRLGAPDLDITLLTPVERFDYRPLSILEPFRGVSRWSLSLATFAADQDITVTHGMWWPPSKIAGQYLAPYLASRDGPPRAPEARPEHDDIPITIDIPRAVHAVSSALDPLAVPPG